MVVTRSQDGEVVALAGGREPLAAGFNRALDAIRPIGSLIKPAIYLTALSHPLDYTLITPLEDRPVRLQSGGLKVGEILSRGISDPDHDCFQIVDSNRIAHG